jgi:hypothetical protein
MITGFCFHTTSKSFLLQKTNTSIHGDWKYRRFRSCYKLPGVRGLAIRFAVCLLDVYCYTNVLPQVFPRKSSYLFHVDCKKWLPRPTWWIWLSAFCEYKWSPSDNQTITPIPTSKFLLFLKKKKKDKKIIWWRFKVRAARNMLRDDLSSSH